jgi:hypothetical protein
MYNLFLNSIMHANELLKLKEKENPHFHSQLIETVTGLGP